MFGASWFFCPRAISEHTHPISILYMSLLITLIHTFFFKYCFVMYDTSSWTYAVYRHIFRIFLSPSVKKKYVIQKNNIYSYFKIF
jgi:hypothetical protein